MLAGILSKLGKIGVILGFLVGNAVLTYVCNGNIVPIITIREILVASLGLLLIPKDVEINIEDIIGTTKFLPVTNGKTVSGETKAIYKLNQVSETISEMAQSCKDSIIEDTELEKEYKQIYIQELINNVEELTDNILYEDIMENEDKILEDICEQLEEKEELDEEDLIKVFENHNNYIVGQEDDKVKNDINEMIKQINDTYKISKLNIIVKQRIAENKKALSTQLSGVSKVISSIAENITETEEKQEVQENFKIEIATAKTIKNKSKVSGDTACDMKLQDGKYMIALSDGMGSGEKAKKSSQTAISMLKKLLLTGFSKQTSMDLINTAIKLNSEEETYATIDVSIINLENGNIEFIKNGCCPTYIKNRKKVEIVKTVSLPAGILDNVELVIYDKDLKNEDIIVMCTDGIIESATEYKNKELWLKNILEEIETTDIQKIADIVLGEAIDNGYGMASDDMTVVVAKIEKK